MRESGYYFVKLTDASLWTIGMWLCTQKMWMVIGMNDCLHEDELFEIDETKIERK